MQLQCETSKWFKLSTEKTDHHLAKYLKKKRQQRLLTKISEEKKVTEIIYQNIWREKAVEMSGTIEDIAKKWLAEPAYNKVSFSLFWLVIELNNLFLELFWLACNQEYFIHDDQPFQLQQLNFKLRTSL